MGVPRRSRRAPALTRRSLLGAGAAAVLAGCSPDRGPATPVPASSAGAALVTPSSAPPVLVRPAPSAADVAALLQRRGDALVAGDLAAALAEVDQVPGDLPGTALDLVRRSDERAVEVGVGAWAADVVGVTASDGASSDGASSDGAASDGVVLDGPALDGAALGEAGRGPATHVADLLLRVRVQGEDREVVTRTRTGVVLRDGTWRLVPVDDPGPPQPWDLGDVDARRVERGVVLRIAGTGPGTAGLAREVAADLADAARRVDAAWGTDWPRTTAVVLPATAADAARLAGVAPEQVGALDALAVGAEADLPDGRPAGVRVVLQPERFPGLSRLGRRVTLTHELVHVATRAASTVSTAGALPRWLVEGYADYVARAGRGLDATALARPLLAAVAAGRPVLVPDDAAFAAADADDLQVAYAAAWTLVVSVARRASGDAVTGLYRGLAAAPERGGLPAAPPAQRLDEGCRRAVGETFDDVRQRWVADVEGGLDGWS